MPNRKICAQYSELIARPTSDTTVLVYIRTSNWQGGSEYLYYANDYLGYSTSADVMAQTYVSRMNNITWKGAKCSAVSTSYLGRYGALVMFNKDVGGGNLGFYVSDSMLNNNGGFSVESAFLLGELMPSYLTTMRSAYGART